MQDKVFETFRRLFANRDPELMKILNTGRDTSVSAFMRQIDTPRSSLPAGTIGLIVKNIPVQTTKESALDILQCMMNENCDKGEILKQLEKLYGWEGIAQMFHLLINKSGIEPLKSNNDIWEMSAQQPQYNIEIRENKDIQAGISGICQVVMCDRKNHKEKEIMFTSKLHKAIYIWMLLHPRQAISRAQINEGLKHQVKGKNGKSISFYEMLYGAESEEVSSEKFTQIFSHIKRAVKTAWQNLSSKGDLVWYTIEGGTDKSTKDETKVKNEEVNHYYINLPNEYIIIKEGKDRSYGPSIGQLRESDFRMREGTYSSIDSLPQKD